MDTVRGGIGGGARGLSKEKSPRERGGSQTLGAWGVWQRSQGPTRPGSQTGVVKWRWRGREGGREQGGFLGEQWAHWEMRRCRASRSLLYDQKLKVPGPLSPEKTAEKSHLESVQTPDAQAALRSN